jgi:hypothetical protein
MSGQKISYKEKKNIVEDFIARVNPYEKQKPLNFDLRGYSDYLEKNGLSGEKVSNSIIEKFQK